MALPAVAPALSPAEFLRSIDATRATLGKSPMKLLALVEQVKKLTGGAPYAVLGGLAQILAGAGARDRSSPCPPPAALR